jgi:hypothetical protein
VAEKVILNEELLALVVRAGSRSDSVNFVTSPELSLQLGLMYRTSETPVKLHKHNSIMRQVDSTLEFILIQDGECLVRLFSESKSYCEISLLTGDCILIVCSTHSITFSKPTYLLEIKQGPYLADRDKVFIEPEHN